MELLKELWNNTKPINWWEGTTWLLWSLIGGLFPVWIAILIFGLTKQNITFSAFADNGEFALYSASYLAGTLYILFKDFRGLKGRGFPSRSPVGLLSTFFLLMAAAMFGLVCALNSIGSSGKPELLTILDKSMLRNYTMATFIFSMCISFLVVVADSIRSGPDLHRMAEQDYHDLNSEFDKLGD